MPFFASLTAEGVTDAARLLREYVTFYNAARPHQALDQTPPGGDRGQGARGNRIVGEPVLGGLHHVYRWAA